MTQATLPLRADTYTDRVIAYLSARAGQWVDGLLLAKVAGAYAWRSRVSDARRLGHQIENRQRKTEDGRTISEYRLVRGTEGRAA